MSKKIHGLEIETLRVGLLQANCYLLYDENMKECIVIDPGAEAERIANAILEKGLVLTAVLLTHCHFDHVMGANELVEICGKRIPIYIHEADKSQMEDASLNSSQLFGVPAVAYATNTFVDQEELEFAGLKIRCIHTPGHTAGGACFYFEDAGIVFSGDTLFFESVGGTDFPSGNDRELICSIEEKIFALPEEVVVACGHGEPTTVGYEKKNNPYVG